MGEVKSTHNKKLLKMWLRQRPRSPECLVNLSKRKLTLEEQNVLYRGLNHHILPAKVNGDQLRVDIEKFCKNLSSRYNNSEQSKPVITNCTKDEIRCLTRNFLRSARSVCSSRRNSAFQKHLKALGSDNDIAVTKYDKGNGVCLMDKVDYLKKLDDIISDKSKFTIVLKGKRKNAKHPLLKKQDEILADLKTHLKQYVDKPVWRKLSPSGTNTRKLYGTSKVHKPGYPLRPIVSMVNTPVYNLAKYLDGLIKPLIPNTYTIDSNAAFLEQLRKCNLKSGDYCISFDVVSLFTNIPLHQTINIIADSLYANTSTCTPVMPRQSFVALLKCATGVLFSHRQQLYQHTKKP